MNFNYVQWCLAKLSNAVIKHILRVKKKLAKMFSSQFMLTKALSNYQIVQGCKQRRLRSIRQYQLDNKPIKQSVYIGNKTKNLCTVCKLLAKHIQTTCTSLSSLEKHLQRVFGHSDSKPLVKGLQSNLRPNQLAKGVNGFDFQQPTCEGFTWVYMVTKQLTKGCLLFDLLMNMTKHHLQRYQRHVTLNCRNETD